MHTHTTIPPPLFSSASSTNVCSMHMPGCVGCLSALHVPAATRLQQHTPKTKTKQTKIHSDECTAWHTWHAEKTSLGKAHTHTHRHGGSKARTPAAETMRPLHQHARTHARTHMQHTATGPGCEGKERRGKGGDSMGEKIKGGRGTRSAAGALALDWHHLRACAPTRCPALHRSRLQKGPRGGVLSGRRKEVR